MHSDFSATAKRALERIPAPEVPMASILMQSAARKRGRIRTLLLSAVICLATIGTAAAFGTSIYSGVRVWLLGNRAAVSIQSFVMVRDPGAAQLRDALARATFPVVLPLDIPANTTIPHLQFAPADHPNSIFVEYRNRRAKFNVGFALFDSSAVNESAALPAVPHTQFGDVYRWTVGRETVIVPKRAIARPDVERIRAAMLSASPETSVSATLPMLSKAVIVGAARTVDLAELAQQYAPAEGNSVLIGPQFARSIPDLAKAGKGMPDTRTIYLTKIPWKNGEPDYAKATLQFSKDVAIDPSGVRAINAVYRASKTNDCGCVVLFNRPDGITYRVIEIPLAANGVVKKYAVNAKTLKVAASH